MGAVGDEAARTGSMTEAGHHRISGPNKLLPTVDPHGDNLLLGLMSLLHESLRLRDRAVNPHAAPLAAEGARRTALHDGGADEAVPGMCGLACVSSAFGVVTAVAGATIHAVTTGMSH